ncbi:hypothetical protein [Streptomyces sp. 43Y-GA-1]|nr:hypothetical protein [Streptomyces sp. 43Y-GA-1]MCL6293286.1 hypothetical protein [Streptomyces sp. 43Y-GA-1]
MKAVAERLGVSRRTVER